MGWIKTGKGCIRDSNGDAWTKTNNGVWRHSDGRSVVKTGPGRWLKGDVNCSNSFNNSDNDIPIWAFEDDDNDGGW